MTKIKICGVTNPADIKYLNELLPDFAGFVMFFEKSHRSISADTAKKLLSQLDRRIKSVAVTVEPTKKQLDEIYDLGFDYVQIHGNVGEEVIDYPRLPVIRAVNVSGAESLSNINSCRNIKGILFDSHLPGSGKVFDWSLITEISVTDKMLFLAGGLTPENVAQAMKSVHPFAVDVSSGVELADKSGKDYAKIKKFIENVRKA